MEFWSQKIWISCLNIISQNGKMYVDSHSNFFYYDSIYNVIQNDKLIWKIFSLKTLTIW
jgi:hypothetical protein